MTASRPMAAVRLLMRARSTTLSLDEPTHPVDPNDPEVLATLEEALASGDVVLALELAAALRYVWLTGETDRGIAFIERALALPGATPLGLRGDALNALGMLLGQTGRIPESCARLTESVEIHRRLGSGPELARALTNLGLALHMAGDNDGAERTLVEAVAVAHRSGAQRSELIALHELGSVASSRGDLRAARGYVEDALRVALATDDRDGLAATYDTLGAIALLEGRRDDARELYAQSLREHARSVHVPELAHALMGVALMATEAGDLGVAARLIGAADATGARGVLPNHPIEDLYAAARARLDALGGEERDRLVREGSALERADAIALALGYVER